MSKKKKRRSAAAVSTCQKISRSVIVGATAPASSGFYCAASAVRTARNTYLAAPATSAEVAHASITAARTARKAVLIAANACRAATTTSALTVISALAATNARAAAATGTPHADVAMRARPVTNAAMRSSIVPAARLVAIQKTRPAGC